MIRPATAADAARIAEINVFSWRSTYRGIVPDGFLFGKLSVSGRTEATARALADPDERFLVLEDQGILQGFARFGPSRDGDKPGAAELCALYVDPAFVRQGVGRCLVAEVLTAPEVRSKPEVLLWVFRDNHGSRRFYEAMGFAVDGAEQDYAGLGMAVRYVRPSLR